MIKNQSAELRLDDSPKIYLSAHGPFHSSNSIYQFYGGGGRGELLDQLSRHVQNCDEPVLVRGEPGSGKTMLCQVLAHRLRHKFRIVCYSQLKISSHRLLHQLVSDVWPTHVQSLVAQLSDNANSGPLPDNLNFAELKRAIAAHPADLRPILLIIDTPDKINAETQIFLDRLGGIQRDGYPIFKIIVLQSFQHDVLVHPQSREREWGVTTFNLRRLSLAEIHDYLQHHMLLFDFHKRHVFTREMSYFIADRSEGVFRAINILARNAFMLASIQNDDDVSMEHLLAAGLPQKESPPESRLSQIIRVGGLKFAIAVSSVVVLSATWWLTSW